MSFDKNCTNVKSRFVHGYQMEAEPEKTLTKACTHLGMFYLKTFIDQCASVVVNNIQPREAFERTKHIQSKIRLKQVQFPILRQY